MGVGLLRAEFMLTEAFGGVHAIERVRGGLLIDGQIANGSETGASDPPRRARELVFDAGSMGPKEEAALDFATSGEGWAAIGAIEDAAAVLRGDAGTRISVRAEGLELIPPGWSASP